MAHDIEVEIERFIDAARHYQQCLDLATQNQQDNNTEEVLVSNLQGSRRTLLENIARWKNLVSTPTEHWEQTTINVSDTSHNWNSARVAIYKTRWLLEFNIPALVPEDDQTTITYRDLAAVAGVPEQELCRILRFAMTQGLFDEPTPNRVAHTPYSLAFSRNEDYRQVVLLQTGFFAPMMKSLYEAVKSSEAAKGRSAFNLAMETDDPFYAYVSKHPELTKRFGAGMRFVSSAEDTSPQFLSDGFDWARLGKAHVVDVGGSMGHVSASLAKTFPLLHFTVQDLPAMVARAKASPSASLSQLEFVEHDFFQSQPEASRQADVFLLRLVLNNWPTSKCREILSQIAAAMKPSAKVVINNFLLHDRGTLGKRTEALERARDLFQMAAMNGMERDVQEWHELIDGVDGLDIEKVVPQVGGKQVLVVARKSAQ
ncbi:hypothetical protein LTS17_008073 [Exophiala oligosperma]